MFGYITPDKPNMYMKDYAIYKAFYCGICKCTGKMSGQLMRLSTNYDITFISILLHNICEQDIELSNERCILNPLKKRSVVSPNSSLKQAVWLNTLLADFKLKDDVKDTGRLSRKLARFIIAHKTRKASKEMPEISVIIDNSRVLQDSVESELSPSIDKAAHPFAEMLKEIFVVMCGHKYTDEIGRMLYQLGRFIYVVDAIDDIDEDIRRNQYNPLRYMYNDLSKQDIFQNHIDDIRFLLNSSYSEIKLCYQSMDFKLCEGVVTNILWYGIDTTIKRVLSGDKYVRESL